MVNPNKTRPAPQRTANNVVVGILVSGERQRDLQRSARPAGEQTATDALGIETGFVLSLQRFGVSLSRLEIRLDLNGSSEIVTDNVVDIGQIERWILLDNFLRGSAVTKRPYHSV